MADAGGAIDANNSNAAKTIEETAKAKEIAGSHGGISNTVVGNTANTSARVPTAYTATIPTNVVNSNNTRQRGVVAAKIPLDNNNNSKDSMVILLNELAPDYRSGLEHTTMVLGDTGRA